MKNPLINPCAAWAKKLAATHPDDLSISEQSALLAHLEKCPACAAIRLEYQLMDSRVRNYPANEHLFRRTSLPLIPEYEFHRLRLLLRRQAERNHGFILIVVGIVFFLLVLIYLIPLFLQYQGGFILVMVDIVGTLIPMYFLWKGIASVFSSLRPVAIEEVKQQRHQARRVWYLQARGEVLPDCTFGRKMEIFLIESGLLVESGLTISGGLILLLHILDSKPVHSWAYILLLIMIGLIECLLILDTFYLAPKQTRELPVQSAQELSRLLMNGEATTGEEPGE